jgi:hypothetical protein
MNTRRNFIKLQLLAVTAAAFGLHAMPVFAQQPVTLLNVS